MTIKLTENEKAGWDAQYYIKTHCGILGHGLVNTRPYMSHLKAKIKRPDFRKLRIFEFPFYFGDRISKEKNYGSSEN